MQSPMLQAARRAASGRWPQAAASPMARMGMARWLESRPSVWLRPVLFTGAVALGSFAASAVVREEGAQSARPSGGIIAEATRRFLSQGLGLPSSTVFNALPVFNPVVCVLRPPNNERWECRASDVQPKPYSEPSPLEGLAV